MITTTTNNVEGYTISKYIGIINANIVIGTNIFSDIFASLTDVFGGHSGSYQGKLTKIYEEVMSELITKAHRYNADAIVGLHIDFDEISGGGKTMFMVSASGTAVLLREKTADRYTMYDMLEKIASYKEKGIISAEEYLYEKEQILNKYLNPISDESRKDLEEKKKKEQIEIQRIEKLNKAKELLKERIGCTIDDIQLINKEMIQGASYDDISYDTSDSMQYIVAKFIRLKRIPEACKFYMEETGLEEPDAAIDFCVTTYNQIIAVDNSKIEALIPKLKVLKKRGFMEQAIAEYQKLAIIDRDSAIEFISSLESN